MDSRVIRQGISDDSLFKIIAQWCKDGSGKNNCRLRFMSAFATGSAIAALAPLFDIFLAGGNTIEVIIGVDRNGTDRGAVRHLDALLHAYPGQCKVSVFHAPSNTSIFHPKLYLFDSHRKRSSVIGSGNLTGGGLGSNFESLIYYKDYDITSEQAQHSEEIWTLFATPTPPLRSDFLKPLTENYLRELLVRLPKSTSGTGEKPEGATYRDLWRSLSSIPLPSSTTARPRKPTTPSLATRRYLLIDVLTETRYTQMQIPLPVVEGFFGVSKHEPLNLQLSILTKTGLSQPILRTLVISQGFEGQRLMRRIEIPQIGNMQRPLAAVFIKLAGQRRFAFKLLPQESVAFRSAKSLLDREGQQGARERRFIIGRPEDSNWPTVSALLSA